MLTDPEATVTYHSVLDWVYCLHRGVLMLCVNVMIIKDWGSTEARPSGLKRYGRKNNRQHRQHWTAQGVYARCKNLGMFTTTDLCPEFCLKMYDAVIVCDALVSLWYGAVIRFHMQIKWTGGVWAMVTHLETTMVLWINKSVTKQAVGDFYICHKDLAFLGVMCKWWGPTKRTSLYKVGDPFEFDDWEKGMIGT